ncbi:MAG: hypothetical protein Q9202_005736 [Teloschistes flavicans]
MSPRRFLPLIRPFLSCPDYVPRNNLRSVHTYTPRVRLLPKTAIFSSQDNARQWRRYASKSSADETIEEITEMTLMWLTFEIASEETSKKSLYAADDRAAARSELDKLKTAFETAVQGDNGEEIRRRIGQRIRELERGVEAMEERAMED